MRTIDEILRSTAASLFPDDFGQRRIEIDSRDCDGDTPLHVLLWRRDFSGAKVLIQAGADPNAVGDMGETPLHLAVRQDASEIVGLLLTAGADPEICSEFGYSPRALAVGKKGAIAKLLK